MGGSHKEEEVTIVNKDVQEARSSLFRANLPAMPVQGSNTADAEKPTKEYDPAEITEQDACFAMTLGFHVTGSRSGPK